ncbi:MAG: N-acetyltransferase [Clostridia bacterium]|nr:N-acetyltransferase [Clostridia bacterium]
MIEVREIKTKKEQRDFLKFPLDLYRDNENFVPPLWGDEKKIFRPDYIYYDTCEAVYYGAYKDGVMVGRISGILQRSSNEKWSQKRVRFTRFDSIDDVGVARALFDAVERWAAERGMDTVCGPLGFSDLEREGLLIEGFDELSTFEEQYNAEYYGRLIEECGYAKEVDWIESKIYAPDEDDGTLDRMADFVMKRYNLRYGGAKNVRDFINRYADQLFELLDKAYDKLYGTVPFTDRMKKMLIDNFLLIVDLKYVDVILDENDRVICMGVSFPSIAKAVRKSNGHLTPAALFRILRSLKKPEILDLALIAVDEEYMNRGVSTIFSAALLRLLKNGTIKYAETNLNLEDNYAIINQWKRFRAVNHKRRRSYVKKIGTEN